MVEPASPSGGRGIHQFRQSEFRQAQHSPANWRVPEQPVPFWQQFNRGTWHTHPKRQAAHGERPPPRSALAQCVDDGGAAHAHLPMCGFDVSGRAHSGPWEKPKPGLGRHQFACRIVRSGAFGRQHLAQHRRAGGKNSGPLFMVSNPKTQVLPPWPCAYRLRGFGAFVRQRQPGFALGRALAYR